MAPINRNSGGFVPGSVLRYYSTSIGRFLQRDPLGYADGPSLYEYVGSSPMVWTDSWGLNKGMPTKPKSGSTVYGTRKELVGTKKKDGSFTPGYVDKLVKNGVITADEAAQVRILLGNPHPTNPKKYPGGTALTRIGATPSRCKRGDGQSLDVTYEFSVTFWLIFVVLEDGEKKPDPGTIEHEQGHVDIAKGVAGKAKDVEVNEPQDSSKDRKNRQKEIDKGKAPPVTDEDNPPKELHDKLTELETEKSEKDATYDSDEYTGGTKAAKDLTPAQRKALGLK